MKICVTCNLTMQEVNQGNFKCNICESVFIDVNTYKPREAVKQANIAASDSNIELLKSFDYALSNI